MVTGLIPKRRTVEFGVRQPPIDLPPIDVSYALDEPEPIFSDNSGRYTQDGLLFTDRGVDLQHGDTVDLPEGTFGVIGGAQWNHLHPMTGYDYGKAVFTIRLGG
jgi:hypothetical protein